MNAIIENHDHERKDVDVPSLFTIAGLLLLGGITIFIVVTVMMRYFKAHELPVTAGQPNIPVTRARNFPQPRLLVKPGATLADLRAAERFDLNSYGWIDRDAGIVRIP